MTTDTSSDLFIKMSNLFENEFTETQLVRTYIESLEHETSVKLSYPNTLVESKIIGLEDTPVFYLKDTDQLQQLIKEEKNVTFLLHVPGATFVSKLKVFMVSGILEFLSFEEQQNALEIFKAKYDFLQKENFCFIKMERKEIKAR